MKYNQKKKKENIEIFLFIMVMAVFAAVLGVMSLGEKMQLRSVRQSKNLTAV